MERNSKTENCSRCLSVVTILEKLCGRGQNAIKEMSAVLIDTEKIISEIKSSCCVYERDIAAGTDLKLLTEKYIANETIHTTNASKSLTKSGKKLTKQPIFSDKKLNKFDKEDCDSDFTQVVNKTLICQAEEPKTVSNANDNDGFLETIKDKLFDETDASKQKNNASAFVSKIEKQFSFSGSITQSENHDLIENSTNLVQEVSYNFEKETTPTKKKRKRSKKKRKRPKKEKPSPFKVKSTSDVCSEKTERNVWENFSEAINEMAEGLLRKNLENKTPKNDDLEKELGTVENKAHSINNRINQLIEEYTNNLEIIMNEKDEFNYKVSQCINDTASDFYDILNSWVLNFYPPNANADFKNIYPDSSENPLKYNPQVNSNTSRGISPKSSQKISSEPHNEYISENPDKNNCKEHSDSSRKKSLEILQRRSSDAMNEYLSDNASKIIKHCVETFSSTTSNETSLKPININDSDYTKENQLQFSKIIQSDFENDSLSRNSNITTDCINALEKSMLSKNFHSDTVLDSNTKDFEFKKAQDLSSRPSQQFNVTDQIDSKGTLSNNFLKFKHMPDFSHKSIILKSSCSLFNVIKELENLILLSNKVENTSYTKLAQTSQAYHETCKDVVLIGTDILEHLKSKAKYYYEKLNENRHSASEDEKARIPCGNYVKMLLKFSKKYDVFQYEYGALLDEILIFTNNITGSNEIWLDRHDHSTREYIHPCFIMKKTVTLLGDYFNCVWQLRKVLEVDLPKLFFDMCDELKLELNKK